MSELRITDVNLSKSGGITGCLRIAAIDKDGNVWPLERPGLGLEVDEEFLKKHPAIEGPGYI